MAAQRRVASKVWGLWVGRTVDVQIDQAAPGRNGVWAGRVEQQGYEVDGVTYVRVPKGQRAPAPGSKVRVRITGSRQFDLDGEVAA